MEFKKKKKEDLEENEEEEVTVLESGRFRKTTFIFDQENIDKDKKKKKGKIDFT